MQITEAAYLGHIAKVEAGLSQRTHIRGNRISLGVVLQTGV